MQLALIAFHLAHQVTPFTLPSHACQHVPIQFRSLGSELHGCITAVPIGKVS